MLDTELHCAIRQTSVQLLVGHGVQGAEGNAQGRFGCLECHGIGLHTGGYLAGKYAGAQGGDAMSDTSTRMIRDTSRAAPCWLRFEGSLPFITLRPNCSYAVGQWRCIHAATGCRWCWMPDPVSSRFGLRLQPV